METNNRKKKRLIGWNKSFVASKLNLNCIMSAWEGDLWEYLVYQRGRKIWEQILETINKWRLEMRNTCHTIIVKCLEIWKIQLRMLWLKTISNIYHISYTIYHIWSFQSFLSNVSSFFFFFSFFFPFLCFGQMLDWLKWPE